MTTTCTRWFISLASVALLGACSTDAPVAPDQLPDVPRLHSFAGAEWSTPVNLGPPISSVCTEQSPFLSKDELTLYFGSTRPGGLGPVIILPGNVPHPDGCQSTFDLWISRRECLDCPWGAPVNAGEPINTPATEAGFGLSVDERLLFFSRNPSAAYGQSDIYVSRLSGSKDDGVWGVPEALGPDVNTADFEAGPQYLQSAEDGRANFYFSRGPNGNLQDIYYATVNRNGETLGPAVRVDAVSDPLLHEAYPTVRTDGREMFFWGRGGDLWTSTRQSAHDEWSEPVNLVGVNAPPPVLDRQPRLSFDARTLLFSSTRAVSLGEDIWMTTRTPSGR